MLVCTDGATLQTHPQLGTIGMRPWVLFAMVTWGLVALFAQTARACVVCVPYPEATHADALVAGEVVVLAREDPAKPFTLAVDKVIKGSTEDISTGVFLPSAIRRRLKQNAADRIVLTRRKGEADWEWLSYADPAYQAFVRETLGLAGEWAGARGRQARFFYFANRLNDMHARIRQQAFLEVARAPYIWIKTVASRVPIERVRAVLTDWRFVEWHDLFILFLGQSKHERDRAYIRKRFESAARHRSTTNLSAWAAVYIETDPAAAVERIKSWYFNDPERSRVELEKILRAFSILADEDGAFVSQRTINLRTHIADAYISLLEQHPEMAGWAAKSLMRWRRRALVKRLTEIQRDRIELDPASALAVDTYLGRVSGFIALEPTF